MMETKRINLIHYRGSKSTIFTGRPQGETVRIELKLNENDKLKNDITFIVPSGTSSINPSFYLGLLYDSIKALGIEEFEKHYKFEIEDNNSVIKSLLISDLEDGKRNAISAINGNSGFNQFMK